MRSQRGPFQKSLSSPKGCPQAIVPEDKRERIFHIQLQGAYVRSGGMVIVGFFSLVAYFYGTITFDSFRGALISVAFVILMNVPLLAILRHTTRRTWYEACSLAVNTFEILGYTSLIYFVGGFRSTYLTPIYAGMIFYVGVLAPRRYPFIMAGFASLAFGGMVALEHFGVIPHQKIVFEYNFESNVVFLVTLIISAILFVVAFMSSYTSATIHEARMRLKQQNLELERANERLMEEIVDRKKAYMALRESEDKLHDIFENVPDGLFSHDLDGNLLETNLGMKVVLGYGEHDPLPANLNIRDVAVDRYLPGVDEYLQEVQKKGKSEGIMRILTKDGQERLVEYKNSLIRDASGRPVGVRGSVRDITERFLAEKEKGKLQEQLQQAKKMEALGTLAGGVAHDLNNILSGIVSYPELLLMEIPQESPLRRPLLTIQKSGEKAASIVQDLLTLARRGVAVSETIDLNACIRDYLRSPEHQRLLSLYPRMEVTTDLQENLHSVAGSSVHVAKTIMNLVTNAAESMPEGGKVVIETANTCLDSPMKGFDAFRKGDYAVLRVTDTGVGMSEKDRERIFDPFYTKKVMGRSGTGLGLTVVWGTVQDMGGHIDVLSSPGEGSTFTIYFPSKPGGNAGDEGKKGVVDISGHGENILVVDDSEEQREIATRILTRLGYQVEAVPSGERAVEYLVQNMADLVLLDMIMPPGIDGLETYKRILKLRPAQKVIIASGYSETERVKEAQRLGAGVYIRKPYLMEKIGTPIRQELAR
ncbi:MAG TPA: response regulator [Deltaproteobacteria bacterium]|nr:response regulator [Deltaproteobacteria bacterium]